MGYLDAMPRITDYDPMTLMFGVIYIDRESGNHPEDGEQLYSQDYYVVAEAPDGARWLRYVGEYGWRHKIDEDYLQSWRTVWMANRSQPIDSMTRDELCDVASKLATSLDTSTTRRLNPDVWHEWQPAYGSQRYEDDKWEWRLLDQERHDALNY